MIELVGLALCGVMLYAYYMHIAKETATYVVMIAITAVLLNMTAQSFLPGTTGIAISIGVAWAVVTATLVAKGKHL